jgi:hypothetical protein
LLSESLRTWRLQPRKRSPRLFWGLLAAGAVLDTFAAGLLACLLTLPGYSAEHSERSTQLALGGVGACGFLAAGLLATCLLMRKPGPVWVCYYVGVLSAAGAAAGAAVRLHVAGSVPGCSLAWTGCLALACGLTLEAGYRHGVLALGGSAAGSLLLFLAERFPQLSGPVRAEMWPTARGLIIAAACGAQAVAWFLGNHTLALLLVVPQRRSSARTVSDGAYHGLALGVLLLACALLLGGMPSWEPAVVGEVAALVGLAILLHARFAGWVQDLGLALGCTAGFLLLVLAHSAAPLFDGLGLPGTSVRAFSWVVWAAAANASLSIHAVRRYWFSCPRPHPASAL